MSRGGALIGFLALACLPASAQWPAYPTGGVPKTASGEPDLAAPAPRTAEGRPDFTGIWERVRGERGPIEGQLGWAPKASPPPGSPPIAHFFDIGAQFEVPYTPWAAEVTRQRMASDAREHPDAHCLPIGNMGYHLHSQPRKIVQTPDLIVILYEANSGVRQIFLDGRPLPDNDPQPWWFGYSVGRWEGDTLVVETTGFRDDVWLDYNGSPLTSSGKMTERFRRPSFGTLEIDVTIEDPNAYTRPFTVRVNQSIMLDGELIEFVCLENEASTRHFDGASR
jgi:hypothetical protein